MTELKDKFSWPKPEMKPSRPTFGDNDFSFLGTGMAGLKILREEPARLDQRFIDKLFQMPTIEMNKGGHRKTCREMKSNSP